MRGSEHKPLWARARPSVTLADIFAEVKRVRTGLRKVRFSTRIIHESSLLGVTRHLEGSESPLDRFLSRLEKACAQDVKAAREFYDLGPDPIRCLCCGEEVSAADFDDSRQVCVACDIQFSGSRMGLFRQ